jgi:hypothetical protein
MKLRAARVWNFRSIVDSELVELADRVSVLVGKNEQGKTTFLRALLSFNTQNRYTSADLPTHLRAHLEEAPPADIAMVRLWLAVEHSDRERLRVLVPSVDSIDEFIVTKYFDSHYSYASRDSKDAESAVSFAVPTIKPYSKAMMDAAADLGVKLDLHAKRLPAFAPGRQQAEAHISQFATSNFEDRSTLNNLVSTFLTALKGLPGQDAAIQSDIAATSTFIEKKLAELEVEHQKDPRASFHKAIPRFVFHSTSVDRIPNHVNIAEFVQDPDTTSKGMANLCKVAGLSVQKIQELATTADAGRRQNFEDNYRSSISGGLNEFWTQESYMIHFEIEKERLIVSVSDKHYDRRIPPSDRSDGFQWYLSFYSALLSEVSATDPTFVLLDNPGLELHADGQRDIKRFLEEKLPATTQVIYVTHSSAMIDTYNLEQVRKVELLENMQGTKIRKLEFPDDATDVLEPVRSAIGASLVTSLISNDFNVLVEGAADKPILEGGFGHFLGEESKRILVNGSVAETGMLLPRFYQRIGLPYVIYLDKDSGGRDLRTKLLASGVPEDRIVSAGDVVDRDVDFELEDTVGTAYHDAVRATYPELNIEAPDPARGKCTKHYERALKEIADIGFSKRRVAEQVKAALLGGQVADVNTEHLRRIVDRLRQTLQAQVRN